ncbi:MAG: FimV/HubP family polar landmark protein [Rhodanobacter sp.]
MNRSLKLSMLMALALGSSQVMALDLGQVQVKSTLGQPLLAEIPLHPVNPGEMQGLTVQLASSEEFARAGIVGGRTKLPLQFTVATNGVGQPVIRITSATAVDDPYLDLLLEVNGKAGKSVREFAILLDPPHSAAAAPAIAAALLPSRSAAAPAARTPTPVAVAVAKRSNTAEQPKAAAKSAAAGGDHYGPVERGQTLSSIARSRAVSGVSEPQMLLAIKQANPDAFFRDNINALKAGAVLRIPTAAEAQTMTVAAAMAEARQQNSDWRSPTPSTATTTVADAATRPTASSAPSSAASDLGDRLALVPAKDGSSANGKGGSTTGKGNQAAQQELLRAQEGLSSAQQQTTELQSRLKDLEDINGKNARLLSLKDNEIAELQNKLAAARKAAGMPVAAVAPGSAPTAAPTNSDATSDASVVSVATAASAAAPAADEGAKLNSDAATVAASTSVLTPASSPVVASTPVAEPATVKPAAVAQPTPAAAAPAEQPWYMQTWAWAAAGGVAVLLLLLALLGRRKGQGVAGKRSVSSLSSHFGEDASTASAPGLSDDPDQAELLNQLGEHPDDVNLNLELVTLYYSRRDVEHFEAAAEAMHAHISDPQQDEWQDVLHMGEDLAPTHPLFDHHQTLPADAEAAARQEFDIDAYAPVDTTVPPPVPASRSSAPKPVSEYNFNFDLTRSDAAMEEATSVSKASLRDTVPPLLDTDESVATAASDEPIKPIESTDSADSALDWQFDDVDAGQAPGVAGSADAGFSDDPVDTKLDLARAYLDMGDADGARAMLDEVIAEGTQVQQDVAKRLLEGLQQ